MSKALLTIITVVHNNTDGIKHIYKSLAEILNIEVQWIIKDSGFCPAILEWHDLINNDNIKLIASKDSGIYDALNTAIKHVTSDYYLVLGSDDSIFLDGLRIFLSNLKSNKYINYDFISFPVFYGCRVQERRAYIPVSWSIASLVASHSCGLVIRKSIHSEVGLYSTDYKILSDSLFILRAYKFGYKFFHEKFIIGYFSTGGVSSKLTIARSLEAFKIQVESRSVFWLQVIFLILRFFYFLFKKISFKLFTTPYGGK